MFAVYFSKQVQPIVAAEKAHGISDIYIYKIIQFSLKRALYTLGPVNSKLFIG